MNLIVAVTENWGIGRNNDLLFKVSEDLKYFRATTTGKVVVMGHNTLKAMPNGLPLKNRTNIVLSRDSKLSVPGAVVCNSLEALFEHLKNYDPQDIFIIGGGTIYKELLPYCKKAYITKFEATPEADTFFPNMDNMPNWQIDTVSGQKEFDGLGFRFYVYSELTSKLSKA